jgi:membrane associated rhomboid family serine protease
MSIINDIKNAFVRRDNALSQLIVLNVTVFVLLIVLLTLFHVFSLDASYPNVLRQFELSSSLPVFLRHPWTLLTYAFTHLIYYNGAIRFLPGVSHLAFNMLSLYWFGRIIQEYVGDRRLVSLYILGALAGAVFFLLIYQLAPGFQGSIGAAMVGASGAVLAVVVAAATLHPDYTFMLFIFGQVKIKWIAFVLVILSIVGVNGVNSGGNLAHLGGALLGYIFIKQLQAGRDLGRPVQAIGQWFGKVFNRTPTMRASSTTRRTSTDGMAARTRNPEASPLQEEVDIILDKISRSGYESLTKEEKQKLFKASQE